MQFEILTGLHSTCVENQISQQKQLPGKTDVHGSNNTDPIAAVTQNI